MISDSLPITAVTTETSLDALESDGRFWIRNALERDELARLDLVFPASECAGKRIEPKQAKSIVAASSPIVELAQKILPGCRPVRFVSFNKRDTANWGVPWHQDRVIAVKERHDLHGYSNWSKKNDVWHCEPPSEVLRSMLFARIHLDDCESDNGCLELAIGSHRLGVIPAELAASCADRMSVEICTAKRSDLLFVKMLMLHRSEPALVVKNRRVLRIDFANTILPAPLEWAFD